jgi:hypothetical protein
MARQTAETLLRNEGISSLPVDPFAIARSRDIVVEPKPDTAEGVSGMLLRHGDTFGILYATHIPSEGFQRFSVQRWQSFEMIPPSGIRLRRSGPRRSPPRRGPGGTRPRRP